jgi:hypothetical protein
MDPSHRKEAATSHRKEAAKTVALYLDCLLRYMNTETMQRALALVKNQRMKITVGQGFYQPTG